MSTAEFKEVASAFARGLDKASHHRSDFKHQEFKDGLFPTSSASVANGPAVCSKKGTVSIALFGLGRAGSIHLGNIVVRLAYVVEADETKSSWAKEQWNLSETVFLTPSEAGRVYADPALECCLVATPTFTHEDIIVDALRAGKGVFSEKPIAETKEGTKRCYEVAKEVGKPLFCAFNRRFDPSMSATRERVKKGEVGHIQMIKTTSRDSPLPSLEYLKISGGMFHDCAVHDIDMITWILGEYPTEVYSAANAQIPEIADLGDFDNIAITLKFPSGSLGLIDLSRYANYGYDQRLEVFGPKGMIRVENDSPDRVVSSSGVAQERCPIYHSFPSRYSCGYQRELSHFLDVVQGLSAPSVTGRMTLAVSKIASACEESARTGSPISLRWKEEEIPDDGSFCIVKT